MIAITTVLLAGLLSCVAAVDDSPPYRASLTLIDQGIDTVSRLSLSNDSSDLDLGKPKHDYALLVAVLRALTAQLACGKKFDQIYFDTVERTVPEAWANPAKVLKQLEEDMHYLRETVQPVRTVLEKYCNADSDTVICDKAVDLVVTGNPDTYKEPAKAVLGGGESVKTYLDNTYEKVAAQNKIISFLQSDGSVKLKNLAVALGKYFPCRLRQ